MITALTIKDERPHGFCGRIRAVFSPYEINIKHINDKYLKLDMLHIKYIKKSGTVKFSKIKRAVQADFSEILCAKKERLPKKLGFKRFESSEYSRQLCVNSAEEYIRRLNREPSDLRISLYDPSGKFGGAAERLIKYTSTLKVATNAVRFYEAENERLMCEYGAAILIRDDIDELLPCDVLVAPQTITVPLSLSGTTAVFTGSRPRAPVGGIVYYSFEVPLPICFEGIKPAELSDTYFLSAMYTLGKMRWLGNIVPKIKK